MTPQLFLASVAEACRIVVSDAVSGISVCRAYEDATIIGFMQLHRLCGVRLLMLQMAEDLGVLQEAESVFDRYFSQLEDIKSGSRSLLTVKHGHKTKSDRSASVAPL